jgi:hypothetical protein
MQLDGGRPWPVPVRPKGGSMNRHHHGLAMVMTATSLSLVVPTRLFTIAPSCLISLETDASARSTIRTHRRRPILILRTQLPIGAAMDIIERAQAGFALCAAGVQVWRNCRKRGSNRGVTLTLAFALAMSPPDVPMELQGAPVCRKVIYRVRKP